MRACLRLCLMLILASAGVRAADAPVIEESKPLPRQKPGQLSTVRYAPTEKEAPFSTKAGPPPKDPKEQLSYRLSSRVGEYVAWFGIVRKITVDEKTKETRLLLEHKYFDGLHDSHIMVVGLNGGGDFEAVLPETGTDPKSPLKNLALVVVYGKAAKGERDLPVVHVEYARQWDWRQFTFMPYGADRTNAAWLKLRLLPELQAYNPHPNEAYYEQMLGKR